MEANQLSGEAWLVPCACSPPAEGANRDATSSLINHLGSHHLLAVARPAGAAAWVRLPVSLHHSSHPFATKM
jgi:hypothetical protein